MGEISFGATSLLKIWKVFRSYGREVIKRVLLLGLWAMRLPIA
jgi:hypothetical protein